MKNEKIWAIIPARAGSKGIPDKNIQNLYGIPLLAHSILFAKKLPYIDKIILSTDSAEYAKIGEKYGAEVPFLRSEKSSIDTAMEEDILMDISNQCEKKTIATPAHILWLRPTHPIRDLSAFIKAYHQYSTGNYSSICVVTEEDPRFFINKGKYLKPFISDFNEKSMIRRQDCPPVYRIFSGELFPFPKLYNPLFLGEKIGFIKQPKECKHDIDYIEDIEYLNYILSTESGKKRYGKYL